LRVQRRFGRGGSQKSRRPAAGRAAARREIRISPRPGSDLRSAPGRRLQPGRELDVSADRDLDRRATARLFGQLPSGPSRRRLMGSSWLLLAQTTSRTNFELTRLQSYTERWHFLVLGLACALVAAFVVFMYRRDSVELRPGIGWVLAALRVAALLGLLAYYLQLEKRTERSVTHNS